MKYFCIESQVYKMTESTYKKLCKKFPRKYHGEIVENAYDAWEQTGELINRGVDYNCLNWITENSTLMIESVDVLNYG